MKIIVTGGAGFIGSAVIRFLSEHTKYEVLNIDKLTYAGNLESLDNVSDRPNYQFKQINICDFTKIEQIFNRYKPDAIIHLAAESHVDRSIDGPAEFINTNIIGTYTLLEAAKNYWLQLEQSKKDAFRFLHVSTDEVFGSLGTDGKFTETSSYDPRSPYSASKASSDHLVRAWHHTYGLPILITNCSNNYGPYQFPEKLIPLMIINALNSKSLPIYGTGENIRDWLYVDDHARALIKVLTKGEIGETYNIGGNNEKTNLEVVELLCEILQEKSPPRSKGVRHYKDLINYVADRPGHDQRYAIDSSKIKQKLGWVPRESFNSGLIKTVDWYLANKEWWSRVLDGTYQFERLGVLNNT